MGWIWYHLIPIRRADAMSAVAQAFPEKSLAERRRIVRANFRHLTTSLLEAIALISYPEERLAKIVKFEGLYEPVAAGREEGRPATVISAHQGSFEFCMGAFGIFHPEIPRVIIARLPKAGFARKLLDLVRERTGIEVFEPKGSLPKVVRRMTEGRTILGFVIDQNMGRGKGVFVPFLGKTACTTVGFSLITRRANAVVVPGWNERHADGTHTGHWGPPVTLSDHPNLKIALLNDAYEMSKRMESAARKIPEQWFWVHRRWKTQPRPGDVIRSDRGLEIAGKGRVGALLDRDGTVNMELGRSVLAPDEITLVPGAAEGIRRLNGAGIPVVLVTNQAAIGRGQMDEADLARIHARLGELLAAQGARIDGIYFCPHHPTEGQGPYRVECDCRKPLPGLLNRAARELDLNLEVSLFVGDQDKDVGAARAAGMRAVVVKNGWVNPWKEIDADEVASDLVSAVDAFLDRLVGADRPDAKASSIPEKAA